MSPAAAGSDDRQALTFPLVALLPLQIVEVSQELINHYAFLFQVCGRAPLPIPPPSLSPSLAPATRMPTKRLHVQPPQSYPNEDEAQDLWQSVSSKLECAPALVVKSKRPVAIQT